MSKIHKLNTDPDWFEPAWDGRKLFELRDFSYGFKTGDRVLLLETVSRSVDRLGGDEVDYTGRRIEAQIDLVFPVDALGLENGWVIFSLINLRNYGANSAPLSPDPDPTQDPTDVSIELRSAAALADRAAFHAALGLDPLDPTAELDDPCDAEFEDDDLDQPPAEV